VTIRRKLLFGLIPAVIGTTLVTGLGTYMVVSRSVEQIRDQELAQIADSMIRHGLVGGPATAEGSTSVAGEGNGIFISQIWDSRGHLIHSSVPAGGPAMVGRDGLSTIRWNDKKWRLLRREARGVTVQVAHSIESRELQLGRLAAKTLTPLVVLLPLLAVFIWIAVGRTLAPLESMRKQVDARTPDDLTPLRTGPLPEELDSLVRALNSLLERLDSMIATRRRFLDDAAHELRSPLAALKFQVQTARRITDPEERKVALARLEAGIDRATHLSEQLLTLARFDAETASVAPADVALDEAARQAVTEFADQARVRQVDLGLAACEPATVRAAPDSLRVLINNLVDNALRHTPGGGRVDVSVQVDDGCPVLEVVDTGPGIPEELRSRVFDRFYRVPGASGPGGGLGLAIVRSIARAARATVSLDEGPAGGLAARVRFPRGH